MYSLVKRLQSITLQITSLVIFALISEPLFSSTTTATVAVSTTVSANCKLNNGTLNFGVYDPVSANDTQSLKATGGIEVRCNKGTTANISLNSGNHSSLATGGSTRAMISGNGGDALSYDIYTNAGYNTVWNSANMVTYTATTSAPTTINLYGKIPAQQDVENNVYTDTIVVTANF